MAGIFSPDVNFNIQPESPVAPVQAPTSFLEGALSLGSNFLSVESSSRGSRGSSGKPDPNLAVFAEDIQKVEGVRQQFGDDAASLYERKVAQKFAQYGVDFGADYKNVYETTTGRSSDFYGKDAQTYALESYQKDPRFKTYYVNSLLELPQDATDGQRYEYAVRSMVDSDFNAAELQRVHNEANYQFTAKSEVAFNGVRKDFMTNIFALAQQREKNGGSITADDVENLVVQWSALKAGGLSQPLGVSNSVFEGQRAKNAEVDAFIGTLEKATSNPAILNRYVRALSKAVSDEGSVESVIVGASLLKDPTEVLSRMSPNMIAGIIKDIGKSKINWSEIANGPRLTQQMGRTNGSTPSATVRKIQDLPPPERGATLNAASTVMRASDAKASAQSALAFADAAVTVGAAMGSGGSDTFLSPEFLRNNFASGNVKNNFTALSKLDPDTAAKVKDAWEYGLGTERVKQSQNLLALEKTITGAKWDGQKYVLAFDNTQFRGDAVTQFNRLLDFTYQGDLSAAARDNFKQIISRNPGAGVTNILESGGIRYLPEALRRRESIAIIDDASNFLNPNLANDEVTTNAPVVGSPTAGEAAPGPDEKPPFKGFLGLGGLPDTSVKSGDKGSSPETRTEAAPREGGLLGLGGFPSSEGPSIGEKAVKNLADSLPDLIGKAHAVVPDASPSEVTAAVDAIQAGTTLAEMQALGDRQRAIMSSILNPVAPAQADAPAPSAATTSGITNVNEIARDPRTGEPIFPAQDELAVEVQNVLKNAGVPESPGLTDSIGKFVKDLPIPSAQAPAPATASASAPTLVTGTTYNLSTDEFGNQETLRTYLTNQGYTGDINAVLAITSIESTVGGKSYQWNAVEGTSYSAARLKLLRNEFPALSGKSDQEIDDLVAKGNKVVMNTLYAGKNGNGDAASGDGYKYRGRGFLQLTGKSNYEAVGKKIGVDLVADPDLLVRDESVALQAVLAFMELKNSPKNIEAALKAVGGTASGKKLKRQEYNILTNPPVPRPRP